jgi:protocatechuate 3,4-dioxygenase beta subunit
MKNTEDNKSLNQGNPVSRRSFLRSSSQSAGSLLLTSTIPALAWAQSADPGRLTVPPWDAVPVCSAGTRDFAGQGPFFIHNDEVQGDIDLFRQDIRGQNDPAAEPGTEMQLHLRILKTGAADCREEPVGGIVVNIWHCDAQGYYSGFGEPGEQNPDVEYRGRPGANDLDNLTRYCRGAGITDENGVVSFRSIFPGWYNGRDIHIHFLAMHVGTPVLGRRRYRDNGHIYTTQFYFEPGLIDKVHKASQPYLRRTTHPAYEGSIQGDERGNSGLRAKAGFDNNLVVAQMQILLDPSV